MGLVQKKKTPVELAEEEVEIRQKSSQFVSVKVYFTVRPTLPPCHCAFVTVPLAARCSDLLDMSWALFDEHREKMGSFIAPLPSDCKEDYMLCFLKKTHTRNSHKRHLAELQLAVTEAVSADQARRKSSVAPGPPFKLSPGEGELSADALAAPPLNMDQLHAVTSKDNSLSNSPAVSHLDFPPRRRSRSASVVSSTTVVTLEPVDEDPLSELSDGEGGSHTGDRSKPAAIVDSVLSEFRAMNRVAHVAQQHEKSPRHLCEECPPSAIVSRLVANKTKQKNDQSASAPTAADGNDPATVAGGTAVHHHHHSPLADVDDGLMAVHLVLTPQFLEREQTILIEEKTRFVMERVWMASWEAMQNFEQRCHQQTKVFEVRRAQELQQVQTFTEKEDSIRAKIMRAEHQSWMESIQGFKKRYNELEVGMIAQYRLMRELRQTHANKMKAFGFKTLMEIDTAVDEPTSDTHER